MAGEFEIQFDDAFAFAARMAQAPRVVQTEMVTAVNRLTIRGEGLAKQILTANGSVVTGHGRRSITHKAATFAGGEARGTYGTAVWYMRLVENGRRGVVARGRALAFKPKGSGKVIFRKRVGPAAPRPFMRPSAEQLRPYVATEFQAAIQRILAQIGGS